MPKTATPTVPRVSRKKKQTKRRSTGSGILTCAMNGAGWCPYPFSIEQLEKRLKEKALAQANAGK
jgi:hypothetical protein